MSQLNKYKSIIYGLDLVKPDCMPTSGHVYYITTITAKEVVTTCFFYRDTKGTLSFGCLHDNTLELSISIVRYTSRMELLYQRGFVCGRMENSNDDRLKSTACAKNIALLICNYCGIKTKERFCFLWVFIA